MMIRNNGCFCNNLFCVSAWGSLGTQSSEASAGEGVVGSCCMWWLWTSWTKGTPGSSLVLSVPGLNYIRN